ncbi:MAG TPA: helix-turn-helix transcriptional regulator [Allosphingosinicella sp.]|nr:helix-turn-helix transcriptional regulator [Allosphingosinicella sp.]
MRLVEWRRDKGLTQQELADALRITQPSVSEMERRSGSLPSRAVMTAIYRFTAGAVTPNDFYDLPDLGQRSLPLDAPAPLPLLEVCEKDELVAPALEQAA